MCPRRLVFTATHCTRRRPPDQHVSDRLETPTGPRRSRFRALRQERIEERTGARAARGVEKLADTPRYRPRVSPGARQFAPQRGRRPRFQTVSARGRLPPGLPAAARREAHALKSPSATFGFLRLSALARDLEACAEAVPADDVAGRAAAIATAYDGAEALVRNRKIAACYGFRLISSASSSLSHPGRACARPGAGSCGRGCPSNARAGEGFLREAESPSPGSDFASLILATLSHEGRGQGRLPPGPFRGDQTETV